MPAASATDRVSGRYGACMLRRLIVLTCSVAALAACSSDASSSPAATQPAGSAAPDTQPAPTDGSSVVVDSSVPAASSGLPPELNADGKVLFAETVNSFLINTVIAYGEQGPDEYALAAAVNDVYPSLSVDGYAMESDGSNVSIMSTSLVEKGDSGAANPYIVAVATRQVSGECFGSAVYGFPLPVTQVEFTTLPSCTAQAVVDALAAQLG